VLACLGSLGSTATCCSAAQGAKANTAFRYFGRYFRLCKRTLKKLDFFQEFCRKLRNNPDPIVRLPLLLMEPRIFLFGVAKSGKWKVIVIQDCQLLPEDPFIHDSLLKDKLSLDLSLEQRNSGGN
jgi:hypothetical protein